MAHDNLTPQAEPPANHGLAQIAAQMGVEPGGEGHTFPVLWDEGNSVADSFDLTYDFFDAIKWSRSAAGLDAELSHKIAPILSN